MKLERLDKKEFEERFGRDSLGHTSRSRGEEPIAYVPWGASAKTILHEIYHAEESPDLDRIATGARWSTLDQLILEELRAEAWAREKMDKDDLSGNALITAARVALDRGYRPASIMGSIVRGLRTLGYEAMDRSLRSDVWQGIREEYESGR